MLHTSYNISANILKISIISLSIESLNIDKFYQKLWSFINEANKAGHNWLFYLKLVLRPF